MSSTSRAGWRVIFAGILSCMAIGAHADAGDPPGRVARLAYLQGGVSFRPAGASDWVEAGLNRPLTLGDQLWSDRDGRIEMQLDGSNLRLGSETSASILNLSDDSTQIQLSSGTLIVHVRRLADNESYEIDTPNVAFSILRPGTYRLNVDANGASTAIAVRSGQGEAAGGDGTGYTVRAGEYDTFTGVDRIDANSAALGPQDEFDAWSAERDNRFDHPRSAQYVSSDVVGYQELDDQGNWDETPEYGHVWFPTGVEAGWAPYQQGHWAYVPPWGYTWIDDRPWGFAPFHYGRWVYWGQRWGWVPVPPPLPRAVYVRPLYAPALVAWVGGGTTVGWFALAPREIYVPSYPVSRRYLDVVNVSNTRINTTIINNVYNTTVINRTTINNVTYANRRVPGAVVATSAQDFASARPVRRDSGVDLRTIANAPVRAFAPPVAPTRAAVYGGRGLADRRPPQAVQTRVTAARLLPAAAPPSLESRLQALRNGGGQAPGLAPPTSAGPPARMAAVRVVPPVHTLVSARDLAGARAQNAAVTAAAPGTAALRQPSPAGTGRGREPPPGLQQQRTMAGPATNARRQQLEQQQALEAQAQASAELARRQQLDRQRSSPGPLPTEQRAQAETQARFQQQAQAAQQRAAQGERQRQLEQQQLQQQRNAALQSEQRAQQTQAAEIQRNQQLERQRESAQLQSEQRAQQARLQQQAQAQAELQRNQQLERQRESAQLQYQRQQQALDLQRQERERQVEQQRQQQIQQLQQARAREGQDRQQEQPRRPIPPPPQNPRQPR